MKRDDDQVDALRWALRGHRTLADVNPLELRYVAQAMEEQANRLSRKFTDEFFSDTPRPFVVFDGSMDKVIEGEYTVVRPLLPAGNDGEEAADGGR